MDAEAEMEGLFGGEDQGQDDAAATQSLTQEGEHVVATYSNMLKNTCIIPNRSDLHLILQNERPVRQTLM